MNTFLGIKIMNKKTNFSIFFSVIVAVVALTTYGASQYFDNKKNRLGLSPTAENTAENRKKFASGLTNDGACFHLSLYTFNNLQTEEFISDFHDIVKTPELSQVLPKISALQQKEKQFLKISEQYYPFQFRHYTSTKKETFQKITNDVKNGVTINPTSFYKQSNLCYFELYRQNLKYNNTNFASYANDSYLYSLAMYSIPLPLSVNRKDVSFDGWYELGSALSPIFNNRLFTNQMFIIQTYSKYEFSLKELISLYDKHQKATNNKEIKKVLDEAYALAKITNPADIYLLDLSLFQLHKDATETFE